MHLFFILANFLPVLLFCGLTRIDEVRLPANYNQFQVFQNNFYFAPRIGNRIALYDSTLQPADEYILTGLPFFTINSFRINPYSFFINDGDSIIQYYPRFSKFENRYRGRGILDFMITEENDIIVIDNYGNRIVFLDQFGRTRNHITRYRVRTLAYDGGDFLFAGGKKIIKLDEFGNEIELFELEGVLDISADEGMIAALTGGGMEIAVINSDTTTYYTLKDKVKNLFLKFPRLYCLGSDGDVIFKYLIDFK